MKYVHNKDIETGLKILQYCEEASRTENFGNHPLLRNETFNNMAVLYRRAGKLKLALNFLKGALGILQENNLLKYSAMTYLNTCAVLSQSGE